ncbi:MAG TPA: hypothetical protein VKO42_03540, partial [Patescibacteria group bacterium]|nr:hypothetical protein [Patescibacteria group bacterium]
MIGSGLLSFGANIASHGVSHSLRSIHPDGGTSRPSQKEFILQDAELPPRTSDSPLPIDAYYTEHAAAGQNIDDLSQLNQTLVASQYLDMRPTSIPATYYTITALKALGPQYLASYADGFEAFFLSRLNESNLHFEETINYSYIAQKGYQGANMVFRVLTPDLIHQMALISLAEMDLLTDHFGSAEIDQWVTEIKNTNNTDGGFGTYVHPDSTIHETYFAVKALYALNGFQPPDLSPTMAGDVVGFLENSQYGYVEMLPFLEGSISEYDTSDPYYGWESFDVDLQAFRICEFLGVESPSLTSGFLGFVADNNLFIQEDSQWVHNWNSKFGSGGDAWGTAIIGECLRILDAQAQFETEIDQSTNAITTHYRQTGISEGENWIYTRMNERTEIYSQCLILEYLNRTGVGSEVLDANERGGIAQFFGSFIGHDGGCSYVPTDRMSTEGLFHQYLFCETESLTQAQKDGLYSDIYDLYWEDVLNGGYY